jgi:ATP-dependent RNA helicase DeaD
MQVAEALSSYAAPMAGVKVLPLYGGADFRRQIDHLRRGTQIVVGTPGRVMDHIRQGTLQIDSLTTLVLDEADEMLRMGFIEDVEWVMERLPAQRQVVLFSATMPSPIRRLAQKYLRDPAEVTITPDASGLRRIRQRFLTVPPPRKLNALERVLEAEPGDGVIVFGRTKAVTLQVAEALELRGHAVAVLNGDVPQAQRERTIERFRAGRVRVLVATDVAARGLDVERVTLVINYDVPTDSEAYVHRIGRTGRAGRRGDAILFLTPRERRFLSGLERAAGQPIEPMAVPDAAAINQGRLERLRERVAGALRQPASSEEERALLAELLQRVAVEQDCSPERLALAALELSLGGRPLLHREEAAAETGPRPDRSAVEEGMERFRIEVGWRQRVRPGHIVGTIAGETGINGRSIGRIRIFDSHSTIDLPRGMDDDVLDGLRRVRLMNKEMRISRLADSSTPARC